MELKLEQVEKLQNDIEVLMKKYIDNTGAIKDWKVQSIAGSIVKNLIIPLVSKRSELLVCCANCKGETPIGCLNTKCKDYSEFVPAH